jgi:putative membrane protein
MLRSHAVIPSITKKGGSMQIARIAVGLVGLVHVGISFGEIFLWMRIYKLLTHFRFSEAEARKVRPIVCNAGLYNAFIASGLLWSVGTTTCSPALMLFFLSCVIIAGVFGAFTLHTPNPLLLQTMPAFIAALLVWFGGFSGAAIK